MKSFYFLALLTCIVPCSTPKKKAATDWCNPPAREVYNRFKEVETY